MFEAVVRASIPSKLMGCGASTAPELGRLNEFVEDLRSYDNIDEIHPVPIQVAHYTPASFPMTPIVTPHTMNVCKESWTKLLQQRVERDGQIMSGLTAFYSEFYEVLEVVDKTGKFESILLQHSGNMDGIVAKGAVLLRIINYALNIDVDSQSCRFGLYMLGKAHNQKMIRPWQYAVFIEVLLNAMSTCLRELATHDVMNSWVHLFAFMLRNMLPAAIRGIVEPMEVSVNISQELGSKALTDEVIEADQNRIFERRRRTSFTSSGQSSNMSSTRLSREREDRFDSNSGTNRIRGGALVHQGSNTLRDQFVMPRQSSGDGTERQHINN